MFGIHSTKLEGSSSSRSFSRARRNLRCWNFSAPNRESRSKRGRGGVNEKIHTKESFDLGKLILDRLLDQSRGDSAAIVENGGMAKPLPQLGL